MASTPAAAADFLLLDLIAGDRSFTHAEFASVALAPRSSALPLASPRVRQTLALRALDAALHTDAAAAASSSSRLLLREARKVLADPDVAAFFPHQIPVAGNEGDDDEARAAAAVADLKRLLDLEWAKLPPSTLELIHRIAGDGAHQTSPAAAHHTNLTELHLPGPVEESTEREILAKLMQDGSASHPTIPPKVADKASDGTDGAPRDDEANEKNDEVADEASDGTGGAPRDDEANEKNDEADHVQEGVAAAQQHSSVTEAEGVQLPEEEPPAPVLKRRSLRKREPIAKTYERDGSDDDQPGRKRKSHPSERNSDHPPKIRKKWSEIEYKALLEGVVKYGRGKWTVIKLAYPDVFKERSTVDLKDKLRNLERRHHEPAA